MLKYTIAIWFCVAVVSGAQLPNYFKKCSLSDPKLNKCLTKSARTAWPLMVRGDVAHNIKTMDPIFTSFLQFPINEEFNGNLTNAVIVGLAQMKINGIQLDLDKKAFDIDFLVPRLSLLGPYKCAGTLIGIQLDGEGVSNTTWCDMQNHLHIEYELKENKGKHYIEIKKNSMQYTITRQYFHLTNLFDGDELRGDKTNKELNEKWETINKTIGTTLGNIIGNVYSEALQSFFKTISYEKMFLP